MSTSTIQSNIIYGLGEGALVANTNMLGYALRWANAAYRDITNRPGFNFPQKRSVMFTAIGQQAYQLPSSFFGFLILKNEEENTHIEQTTADDLSRRSQTTQVSAETFTASTSAAVDLDNAAILQYSETLSLGAATYTRDTDYTINYTTGSITSINLLDATDYTIDYLHYTLDAPTRFGLEYDATNRVYVMRLDPVPDAVYQLALTYLAAPSDLSASSDPVWSRMEYALERGGVYFGSMEVVEDPQHRIEYKTLYEQAVSYLLMLCQSMDKPNHARIPMALRRVDYSNGPPAGFGY